MQAGLTPAVLASPATLARYMPGSTLTPLPGTGGTGSAAASACGWGNNDVSAELNLTTYPAAAGALLRFQSDASSLSQNYGQVTVTGMRWLNDLGGPWWAELGCRAVRQAGPDHRLFTIVARSRTHACRPAQVVALEDGQQVAEVSLGATARHEVRGV